jgi:hypothetical protein
MRRSRPGWCISIQPIIQPSSARGSTLSACSGQSLKTWNRSNAPAHARMRVRRGSSSCGFASAVADACTGRGGRASLARARSARRERAAAAQPRIKGRCRCGTAPLSVSTTCLRRKAFRNWINAEDGRKEQCRIATSAHAHRGKERLALPQRLELVPSRAFAGRFCAGNARSDGRAGRRSVFGRILHVRARGHRALLVCRVRRLESARVNL